MKKFISLFVILATMSISLIAKTPEAVTEEYFTLMKDGKWNEVANQYDTAALKEFRTMMMPLVDQPGRDDARMMIFGPEASVEDLKKMSDQQFFARFLEMLMGEMSQAGPIRFENVEVLGNVKEGEDVVHVVARSNLKVGEFDVESMEVISYKKAGSDDWKVLLSGKFKGIAQQLKQALQ